MYMLQLKLWSSYAPPVISGVRNFVGRVLEVVSGDTLVIGMGEDGRYLSHRLIKL